MFSDPSRPPLTITKAAEAHIAKLMTDQQGRGLKIGIKKGGCAGMEYTMELASEIGQHDIVVEQGAARVVVEPLAQMFLLGTEIDYETGLLDSGFRFRNPNVSSSCGCGESVSFSAPPG